MARPKQCLERAVVRRGTMLTPSRPPMAAPWRYGIYCMDFHEL